MSFTTQVDAPDSKQSRIYYDEAGRVTERRDYLIAGSTYVSVSYEYDNNSQVTVTTDQNTNEWTKTYDAMGRHITTETPEVSSVSYTNTKWYDGNGNVVKVTDFNGADTTYTYNNSNQRTQISYIGAGGGGSDIDIDFDYNCCRMTGYDDTLGSGSVLDYDDFARLISHTDSQGYVLAYVYDSMNRVTKVTDHTSIDTEYAYDLMGRTSTVTYDPRGSNRVTSYTYDGNSNVATATYANSYKSTFTYDAGNRTTQQKVEDTTPTTLAQYDYNYSPMGLPSNTYGYTRSENSAANIYTIAFDRLNRLKLEKLNQGIYTRYSYEHTYDSAGNRTNLTVSGTWQPARNFGYNYDGMGFLTSITENTNLPNYSASVTTDANGNITAITEMSWPGGIPTVLSNNSFEYDRENRLVSQTVNSGLNTTVAHAYDGLGRLVKTTRTVSSTPTEFHHVRDGLKVVGNIDYTNSQTAPTWTNKPNGLMPIESQQLQTNSSQQYINIGDEATPARVTYHPTTSAAGNTSTVNAKGSYSVIDGSAPMKNSAATNSELFYHRSLTVNQNTIALSSDRGSLEIAGVSLLYEGSRVKSYLLGRDLNPMGRGDGSLYAQGMFSAGNTRPKPNVSPVGGFGNSVNNCSCGSGGCGSNSNPPISDWENPPEPIPYQNYLGEEGILFSGDCTPRNLHWFVNKRWNLEQYGNTQEGTHNAVNANPDPPSQSVKCNDLVWEVCLFAAQVNLDRCNKKCLDEYNKQDNTLDDLMWNWFYLLELFGVAISELLYYGVPKLAGYVLGAMRKAMYSANFGYFLKWFYDYFNPYSPFSGAKSELHGVSGAGTVNKSLTALGKAMMYAGLMLGKIYAFSFIDYLECSRDNNLRQFYNCHNKCRCSYSSEMRTCLKNACDVVIDHDPACAGPNVKPECQIVYRNCEEERNAAFNAMWHNFVHYGIAFGVVLSHIIVSTIAQTKWGIPIGFSLGDYL